MIYQKKKCMPNVICMKDSIYIQLKQKDFWQLFSQAAKHLIPCIKATHVLRMQLENY